jgi:hypothetical protein
MMQVSFYARARIWVLAGWRNRAVSFKAVLYALVGRARGCGSRLGHPPPSALFEPTGEGGDLVPRYVSNFSCK